ncbi:unnamed protein product [Polarella glacialis]|uniref:EF-hand domain-containing protein n=1 Tax=Polarella glacialis TaxID=89957 RepID=A0A813KQT6_POLGL|nr:unnamed protein product [Polarella glacialis]
MLEELNMLPTKVQEQKSFAQWLRRFVEYPAKEEELAAAKTASAKATPKEPEVEVVDGNDDEDLLDRRTSKKITWAAPGRRRGPSIEASEEEPALVSPWSDTPDDLRDREQAEENATSGSPVPLSDVPEEGASESLDLYAELAPRRPPQEIATPQVQEFPLDCLEKDVKDRMFTDAEFQVMIAFLQEVQQLETAQQQKKLADFHNLDDTKLFLEFRQELTSLSELFLSFDDNGTGYINKDEVWAAFNSMGCIPRREEDKNILAKLIKDSCRTGTVKRFVGASKHTGFGLALLSQGGLRNDFAECMGQPGKLDFEKFAELLSKVRTWQTQCMREELKPLWEHCVRRRKCVDSLVGIKEVTHALDELGMGPRNTEHQITLFRFLSDANEWGFEPLSLDFEAFVRFIRRVREWRASSERSKDREYAVRELHFEERLVGEYRVLYDIIDAEGLGQLDITQVRKALKLILKKISPSSDQLRDLFEQFDDDRNGKISFMEFLHVVHKLDPPKQRGHSDWMMMM